MVEFKLVEAMEYSELHDFFVVNELEVSDDETIMTDLVKCWKLLDGDKLVGGIALAKRGGEFIIDGIAVDQKYRKQKHGKTLLDTAIAEVIKNSGKSIYLVARAPGFFKTQGFKEIPKEGAPNFFECAGCPQYGVSCHPEVMKLDV